MITLGAVILVLAVLLVLGTVFTNGTEVADLSVFGVSLTNVSAGGLFLGGVVTGALAMLALSLVLGGTARNRHKRVERKKEVKNVRGQAETLEQENARLRSELSSRPTSTASSVQVDEKR